VKPRAAGLAVTLVLAAATSCDRYVVVGREDAPISAGGTSAGSENAGSAGELGLGGEPHSGGDATALAGAPSVGEAGASGGSPDSVPWSADHETGSFDQWLSDGHGRRSTEGNGTLTLSTEYAHSGSHAFVATITANDSAQHQAVMGRDLVLAEGRYGAWYYLPTAPQADYWVIMKLSNGPVVDRFDIDLEVPTGGKPHLRLYEHDSGWITDPSPIAFPIKQWVHVEALYRSTPDTNGRVVVLQDGQQVVDSGARATANDARVTFFCGSSSRYVAPAPYRLFIDDASIREDVVP
jgi:hypothetical protein